MTETFELTSPPPVAEMLAVGGTGEFFAGFIELLHDELVKNGVEAHTASKIVSKIVYKLAKTFAGETFYVTKQPLILARQMAMYADLKTMPHYDVDKKYGVSHGYSLKVAQQIDERRKHREQLRPEF